MQMCVDNGMFTVSFLKEGLQKVSESFLRESLLKIAVPGMA